MKATDIKPNTIYLVRSAVTSSRYAGNGVLFACTGARVEITYREPNRIYPSKGTNRVRLYPVTDLGHHDADTLAPYHTPYAPIDVDVKRVTVSLGSVADGVAEVAKLAAKNQADLQARADAADAYQAAVAEADDLLATLAVSSVTGHFLATRADLLSVLRQAAEAGIKAAEHGEVRA